MINSLVHRQVNKTANYTINQDRDRSGTIFTTYGAGGAVTFTLPTPNRRTHGWFYSFTGGADQNVVVAAPTADTLLIVGDDAADTLTLSTTSQKLGGSIKAVCLQTATGYQWHAYAEAGTGTGAS